MYSDETVYIAMICMAIGGTIIGLTYGFIWGKMKYDNRGIEG